MTSIANSAAETMKNKRSVLNRIKLKLRDLMEDLEQLDDRDDRPNVVQYLAEMIEENKMLSRKCRELAHVVKNLKQEKKENLQPSKRTQNDVDVRNQHELLAKCEHEKLELRIELERLRTELVESQSRVQLLMAQLVTYKEDFDMERKDRERAVEKIGLLEDRLVENNVSPFHTSLDRSHSSQNQSMPSCGLRRFDGIVRPAGCCTDCEAGEHLVLVPRSFRTRKETFRDDSGGRSGTVSSAFDDGERRFEVSQDDGRSDSNKNKRKLDHRDSFDRVFGRKLPSF